MVGVSQFVQRKVRHPLGFPLEDPDVCKLDALFHRGIAFIVAQPPCAWVVFGSRLHIGIFRVEPERDLSKFGNGVRWNDADDLLKLQRQQLHGSIRCFLFLFQQLITDEHRPAFDLSRLTTCNLKRLCTDDAIDACGKNKSTPDKAMFHEYAIL